MDNSTFRVYLTTDTHLGYKEKDEIRYRDTFAAFEEGLMIAKKFDVDLILHAGDLFDTSSPSQYSLTSAVRIMSTYVFGKREHSFTHEKDLLQQKVWDLNIDRNDTLQIHLPVFTIHGNHDPPLTHNDECFSSIDLLSSAGLLNNIGHYDYSLNEITIHPVILKKGTSYLCLYGLGHIRDDRAHKMFDEGRIHFREPPKEILSQSFSIFMIHQNRFRPANGLSARQCISEEMIPEWINFVLWGHEHECEIIPVRNDKTGTFICQPGSTVVTALKEKEISSKQNAILEICAQKFRIHPFPLLSSRQFSFMSLSLGQVNDFSEIEPHILALVEDSKKALTRRKASWHTKMVEMALKLDISLNAELLAQEIGLLANVALPLLRIKIECDDYTVSIQKHTFMFAELCANHSDSIMFKKRSHMRPLLPTSDSDAPNVVVSDARTLLDQVNCKFSVLSLDDLNYAVMQYVDEINTGAIDEYVTERYKTLLNRIKATVSQISPTTPKELVFNQVLHSEDAN